MVVSLGTSEEIGVFSVSVAVVGLAQALRDFGVMSYLIQEVELTKDRIRAAFGVMLAVSWCLAAVVFALSGPVADFYEKPEMQELLWVLCLTFVLIPFGAPVKALLRRDMAFGALYRIQTAAALARATTSVTLAALGFGFMSLAWGSIAGVVTSVLVATLHRPSQAWVWPGFREWRRVAGFGGYMTGAALSALCWIGALRLAGHPLMAEVTLAWSRFSIRKARSTGGTTAR